ncbi:MAG: hypothetical protein J6U24_06445, partial [Paludibacteraceae bacterium]|nr:hypothetical protein [Paludibacteraceae bacterium]
MKKLLLIIISFFPLLSLAETLVTVYVTGSDGVSDVTKQIIGSELVSSIASNPNFRAIEQTTEFLKEIQKERSNNEDQKLCAIGGKYGADKICATNIMSYQNSYYIQARLIDVKQAIVESTAREVSELLSVEQIVSVAESLTSKLIGSTTKQFEKEYSTVLVSSNEECDIIYIDNTGSQTVVGFKLITPVNIQASFSQDSYIYDNETGKSYKVLGVSGIGSNNYQVITAGIKPFTVTFEKIPEATKKIDIIEPDGWYWKNISLVPYDKPNYFEFKDDTESKYPGIALKVQSQINQMQIQAQEEEERKQQELEQLKR